MTIPRKKSRRIIVDGKPYRWLVRHRPTHLQRRGGPLLLAVEGEAGSVLSVTLDYAHPNNRAHLCGGAVTPRQVADWIRCALSLGWDPTIPGPVFELDRSRALAQKVSPPYSRVRTWPHGQRPLDKNQLTALSTRRPFDSFALSIDQRRHAENPTDRIYEPVDITINDTPLIELVRRAEIVHVAREREADGEMEREPDNESELGLQAGNYLSLPANCVMHPCRNLLDQPLELGFVFEPDDPILQKSTLLGCSCGIIDCWPLLVRITLFEHAVVWSGFEQLHRDWIYQLGPFVFERSSYESQLSTKPDGCS